MTVMRMLNVQICLDPSTAPVQMDILEMERIVLVRVYVEYIVGYQRGPHAKELKIHFTFIS